MLILQVFGGLPFVVVKRGIQLSERPESVPQTRVSFVNVCLVEEKKEAEILKNSVPFGTISGIKLKKRQAFFRRLATIASEPNSRTFQ